MCVTIAADNGGQQRTAADDLVQVRHSKVLSKEAASWLRDEEATCTAESGRKCLEPMAGWPCDVSYIYL
jgi:hypothetical protein